MFKISPRNKPQITLEVPVNIGAFRRVKSLLGVDLTDLTAGDPPLIARLTLEPVLVCDVLYCICKPQLDAAGITDEEFGEALDGDSLLVGSEALQKGLDDFFRQSGRSEISATIRSQAKVKEAATRKGMAEIEKLTERAVTELNSTSGSGSTNSAESSDSLPTFTRSASLSGCLTDDDETSGTAQP